MRTLREIWWWFSGPLILTSQEREWIDDAADSLERHLVQFDGEWFAVDKPDFVDVDGHGYTSISRISVEPSDGEAIEHP